MLISNIINDGFGLLSRQLKFYCWHYKHDLDQHQQQELVDILNEHYFERLANKIKSLLESNIADCRQQIGKLLFERCLTGDRRHQLIQLIQSDLVDIDVRLDNYGRTLLHRTAYNLDVELVKLLIDHGVDIRLRDYAGNTALHIVIQSYRNGALIYNNEPTVVQNLIQIIELLLKADKNRQRIDRSTKSEVKIRRSTHNNGCTDLQPHQSKLDDSSDEAEPAEEPQISTSDMDAKLVTDNEIPQPREVTICRMLGSHCMCNTNGTNSNVQRRIETSLKTPESSSNRTRDRLGMLTYQDESSVSLVDTRNAFGRTALHYCVLVVGERHLDRIVELLISHGADPNVIDTRLKTPLYCLVKRPGVAAVRQKCRAIGHLIESGCDDLGLAIKPKTFFTESLLKNLEANISSILQKPTDDSVEPMFVQKSFKRVPTLKHLSRLKLIRMNDDLNGRLRRQMSFRLPDHVPYSLNAYINRKVLDQTELF